MKQKFKRDYQCRSNAVVQNNFLSAYQPEIHGRKSKDGISSLCKRFKNNRDILNGATFNIKCHGSESIFVVPNTLVTLKLTKQEDGQDNYLIKSEVDKWLLSQPKVKCNAELEKEVSTSVLKKKIGGGK